jgi:hypothetical protein
VNQLRVSRGLRKCRHPSCTTPEISHRKRSRESRWSSKTLRPERFRRVRARKRCQHDAAIAKAEAAEAIRKFGPSAKAHSLDTKIVERPAAAPAGVVSASPQVVAAASLLSQHAQAGQLSAANSVKPAEPVEQTIQGKRGVRRSFYRCVYDSRR